MNEEQSNAFYRTAKGLSKDITKVVQQYYEAQVYDEFVIQNNTAVLRCQIPSFVHDYVIVTSWIRERSSGAQAVIESGGRFSVFSNGVLHIRDVNPDDGSRNYRCRTQHRLTGKVGLSTTAGRLIITEPQSSVPPRITHSMGMVEAIQGDAVELPCAAQGYPTPNYSWMKVKDSLFYPVLLGERLLQLGGNLLLRNLQTEDSGTYVCNVNNSVGVERIETTLFVTALLSARIQPGVQVVDVDKPATFTCLVTGYPIASVAWLKDGRPLLVGGRIKLTTREVLRIDSVQREDRGMYQCVARNPQMTAQGVAELKLGDAAPLLQEKFPAQVLDPGQSVSLRCVVSGNPPPQVTWTLDNFPLPRIDNFQIVDYVNIHGDVISHVNISRIRTEDGGEYRCIGKNRVGRMEHVARINVTGPPYIRPMPNVSVVSGSTAVLVCRVSGYPIESVHWERGSTVLPVNHRQKVYSNGTLHVQNVQRPADAGAYVCVALSKNGQTARRTVHVNILNFPMISPFTFPHTLREGMRAGVTCLITEGDLPINIQWLKDGQPIPAHLGISARNMDEYTSSMVIASVSPRHNGNYTCVATNAAASVEFTANLVVNVPARWRVEPIDTNVIQGEAAQIECQADGFPAPTIKWKKAKGKIPVDYQEIPSGGVGRFAAKNGTLAVHNTEENDEGFYLCQASNGVGAELSKMVFLDVQVPAYFEVKNRTETVRKGEPGRLHCEARGDEPVNIFWKLKNAKLDPAADPRIYINQSASSTGFRSTLTISRVERKDYTVFTCVASNAFGQDETKLHLIVQEKPEVPKRLAVVETGSRSVQLSWKSTFDGNSPILRYIVQYKVGEDSWASRSNNMSVDGGGTTATVSNLIPATQYDMRVRAENAVGISNASQVLKVSTEEEKPGGPPISVDVKAISSQALKVTWKPPSRDLWYGQIEGYRVGYREVDTGSGAKEPTYVVKATDVVGERGNEYVIQDLKKFTRHAVVIAAYNRKGVGPKSPEVVESTLEDVPSQPPQDVACTTQSSQSLMVTWSPPPPHAIHGLLQGYKVLYAPADRLQEERDSKTTKSLRMELPGLLSFANYTLRVVAFTRAGDGVRSGQVQCQTKEDVPDAPADIKALVMSSDAILVSWLPPRHPNGVITKYTVSMRQLEHHELGASTFTLPPGQHYFEARGLKESAHYEFWVTASTVVGEGDKTRIVSQSPVSTVPAKIATFPERHTVPLKSDVKLPCRSVGIPTPDREWRLRGQKVTEGARYQLPSDGTLVLTSVRNGDSGNYTCRVYNIYATDELTHEVVVQGPPSPPLVRVIPLSTSAVLVDWHVDEDGGSPIEGYTLNSRRDGDGWHELHLDGGASNHTLGSLRCGSRYQMFMTAHNRLGPSGPSEMVVAKTRGLPPTIPDVADFVTVNSTFVVLHLDAWLTDDVRPCRVHHLSLEYRSRHRREWILIARSVKLDTRTQVVGDLVPNSPYVFRVTAHSDVGPTSADFDVATLQLPGASTDRASRNSAMNLHIYFNVNVLISIIVIVLLILIVAAGICYFWRRRKYTGYKHGSYPMQEKHNRDIAENNEFDKNSAGGLPPTYSPATKRRLDLSNTDGSCPYNQGGLQDEICPYATYQLPGCVTEDDGAVEFQTFSHLGRTGALNQQANAAPAKVIYSKVKKLRNAPMLELQRTQTQGYDGRVAYEEKKFSPTLHDYPELPSCDVVRGQTQLQAPYTADDGPLVPTAPPAEYDATGSLRRKEGKYAACPIRQEQPRNKSCHRVPDLLHHRPDSSTSNEVSPDSDHRSSSHGNSRCSSPESTTEEVGYSYSRSLGPPNALTDQHDLCDADDDRLSGGPRHAPTEHENKRIEAANLAAAEEELIALLKRGSTGGNAAATPQYRPTKTDYIVRV